MPAPATACSPPRRPGGVGDPLPAPPSGPRVVVLGRGGGGCVSEFRSEISSRIDRAKGDLARGTADGDDSLVDVSLGELESLARIAVDHDIPLDGVDEALAPYGLRTPAAGLPLIAPAADG